MDHEGKVFNEPDGKSKFLIETESIEKIIEMLTKSVHGKVAS